MEILIIGIALVALMVFVSTRIKKTAATAFDREKIDAEKFTFFKPEGYIIPVKKDSEFALEAYSKDKGTGDAGKLSQSQAILRVYQNAGFSEICRRAEIETTKVISSETARDGDLNYYFMRGEYVEKNVGGEVFYKIIENGKNGEIYELKVSILSEYLETYSSKASAMLQSFTLKVHQKIEQ